MSKVSKPVAGQKKWLRRKGCRNCALQWSEEKQTWYVVPMVPGKPVTYVGPIVKIMKEYISTEKLKNKRFFIAESNKNGFRMGVNSLMDKDFYVPIK